MSIAQAQLKKQEKVYTEEDYYNLPEDVRAGLMELDIWDTIG